MKPENLLWSVIFYNCRLYVYSTIVFWNCQEIYRKNSIFFEKELRSLWISATSAPIRTYFCGINQNTSTLI